MRDKPTKPYAGNFKSFPAKSLELSPLLPLKFSLYFIPEFQESGSTQILLVASKVPVLKHPSNVRNCAIYPLL